MHSASEPVRKLSSEGVRQTPVLVVISIQRIRPKELPRQSLVPMERKEDAGGRRTNMPGKLLALAPPPGTVRALIGAAISLPEYLSGRQHVDVPPFFPDETLGN